MVRAVPRDDGEGPGDRRHRRSHDQISGPGDGGCLLRGRRCLFRTGAGRRPSDAAPRRMGRRGVLVCHSPSLLGSGIASSRGLESAATGRQLSFHWRAFDEGLDPRGPSPKCGDGARHQRARLSLARLPRATPPGWIPVSPPRAQVDPLPPRLPRR